MDHILRPSSFNCFFPPESNFGVKVFNTVTRRTHCFKASWEEILIAAKFDDSIAQHMLNEGLLTRAENYLAEIDEYYKRRSQGEQSVLSVVYTVTLECALHCPYCFQRNQLRTTTNINNVERFLALLENYLDNHSAIRRFQLVLFGGDPILRYQRSLDILNGVAGLCKSRDIIISSLMTTNGLIVTPSKLDALKSAGLSDVMITFDGGETRHNENRAGSFKKLITNLPNFAQRFGLVLKYNLTPNNSCIDEYLEFLTTVENVLPNKDFVVALEAIHLTCSDKKNIEDVYPLTSIELPESILELYELTRQKGIGCNLDNAFHPPCSYSQTNSLIIQPDGTLSVCNADFNNHDFNIGSLNNCLSMSLDREDFRENNRFAASGICSEIECALFPICETGCPSEKKRLGMDYQEPLCRKDAIEKFLPYLVAKGED